MLYFRNDYQVGCIPEIMKVLEANNSKIYMPHGQDVECQKAKDVLQSKMPDVHIDVHFVSGGTIANATIFKAILKPYEAVIACKTAHIATREAGAIEATGHKVIIVDDNDGKITPAAIEKTFNQHMLGYGMMVYPKAVFISNATEMGTIYSEDELHAIHDKCKELGLYLILDGERLGVTLMSGVGYTLNDIAKLCDIFTIGISKNGGLFGSAIVITNPELEDGFPFVMKQTGAIMAKSWLIGLQFQVLFQDDTFYQLAKHEDELSIQLQNALHNLGYPLLMKAYTNQVFPILTNEQFEYLSERVDFDIWDEWEGQYIIRLVTGFTTTQQDINDLCEVLKETAKIKLKK